MVKFHFTVVTVNKQHERVTTEFDKDLGNEMNAERYAMELWNKKGNIYTHPKEIYIDGLHNNFATDWYKFTMKWEASQITIGSPKW